jgi:hypothetical protein
MSRRGTESDGDTGELRAAAERFAKARWRRDRAGVDVYVLRDGDAPAELIASEDTARALFDVLASLPARLEARERELRRLQERIEDLEARETREAAAPANAGRARGPATLEDVPLALVAPFRPSPQTLADAKRDALLALAVQATKAMQPDAKELERARLNAMAYAASRRDMDAFWAASKQRSVKPPKR